MASDSQSDYEKDIIEIKKLMIEFLEKNPESQPITDEEREELVDLSKKYLKRISGSISPP